MQYTYITPPASRAADRPSQVDDALVSDARHMLRDAVESLPFATGLNRGTSQVLFAGPMATLTAGARSRGVPIEKLIIAIKLAWASLPEIRPRLGETASDALAGAVSACIEAYYLAEAPGQVD
jgi:hypothetical protein